MVYRRYFLMLVFLLTLQSCDSGHEPRRVGVKQQKITNLGTYEFPTFDLVVYEDAGGTITAKVLMNGVPIGTRGGFSKFHRWFLVVDEHDRVWIFSGDIGIVVLSFNDFSFTSQLLQLDSPPLFDFPEQILTELPADVQARWRSAQKE